MCYVRDAVNSSFTEDASMIDYTKSDKYLRLASFGMGPYVMKKLKVCKNCGQITGAWRFFCPSCKRFLSVGTLFDTYKRMHFHCPYCKIMLTADTQYCPHCGRKVSFHSSEQMTEK